jgi:putative ATP-dependent endonuclease of the OLD family
VACGASTWWKGFRNFSKGEDIMLTLRNLEVKGFRSLSELNLPMKNFCILIGKNNAGKSNVLRATKLLLEASARDVSEEDFYKKAF